jgi:hypothetical protein
MMLELNQSSDALLVQVTTVRLASKESGLDDSDDGEEG